MANKGRVSICLTPSLPNLLSLQFIDTKTRGPPKRGKEETKLFGIQSTQPPVVGMKGLTIT